MRDWRASCIYCSVSVYRDCALRVVVPTLALICSVMTYGARLFLVLCVHRASIKVATVLCMGQRRSCTRTSLSYLGISGRDRGPEREFKSERVQWEIVVKWAGIKQQLVHYYVLHDPQDHHQLIIDRALYLNLLHVQTHLKYSGIRQTNSQLFFNALRIRNHLNEGKALTTLMRSPATR